MSIDIRLPNITASTTEGQMKQMQSYVHQLVQQLNWALNTVNEAASGNTSSVVMSNTSKQVEDMSPEEAANTFNSIKSLIIKSADIVAAYEETIREDFSGEFVAVSDFGTYTEKTDASIERNSEGVTEVYSNVQTINNNLQTTNDNVQAINNNLQTTNDNVQTINNNLQTTTDNVQKINNNVQTITNPEGTGSLDKVAEEVRSTNAYIKRGLLGYDKNGNAVYGMAVGETDDKGVYNQYAWFTSNKLSFFDGSGNEVAYISANKLYITDAIFLGIVLFGSYRADTSDGLAFTWVE